MAAGDQGILARMRRETIHLLVPLLLFALTPAVRSEEPQKAPAPVEVRLTEYAIEMPHTLPAGPTTFRIRNEGNKTHSFKIEGPGIDQILSPFAKPQGTGTLEVTLQPGEYKIYCPLGSHARKGMTMTLTVTPKPGG